jgi:hypothetical protein
MLYQTVITAYEAHRLVNKNLPQKSTIYVHPHGHALACYIISSNGEAEFFDHKSIKKKPYNVFSRSEQNDHKIIDEMFLCG